MRTSSMRNLDTAPDDAAPIADFRQHLSMIRSEIALIRREIADMRAEVVALWQTLLTQRAARRGRPHYLMLVPDPRPPSASYQEFGHWEPQPAPHMA